MVGYDLGTILAFGLYLVFMLFIGWSFYGKNENTADYFLAGRKLGSWVVSMSAQASDMSGWMLMGLPGLAYATGAEEATWVALGLAIGTYLNWKYVAKRLRDYTHTAGNSITIPAYFENRFQDKSKVLRVVAAIFILIFFLLYTASGFKASATLFNSVFGIPYLAALILGGLVVISYTFMGGFFAVCWTDFFQGLLMFFAVLTVPTAAVTSMGGLGVTLDKITAISPDFMNPLKTTDGKMITLLLLVNSVAWGLGYFGQPHILVRFMAINSSEQVKKSRRIAMIWVVISLAAAVAIGMVGRVFLDQPLEGAARETVYIVMVSKLFPSFIAGILLSAILAAIMSTADSQLLVTASALSEDFYKAIIRKNASEKELMWVSRFIVVGVSIVAMTFAANPNSLVFGLVAYAWAGFGATFGPIILLSLFWKRTTRNGALAGIIAGGIITIIWKQLSGGMFDIYEIVPGFICSFIIIVVVSLLDKEPSKKIQDVHMPV